MSEPIRIVEATTDFVDHHVATCQAGRCWLCTSYQQTMPAEYERAIARGRSKL